MNGQIVSLPRPGGDKGRGDHDHEADNDGPDDGESRPMGALLIDSGRLSPDDAQRILEHQKKSGLAYGQAGTALGLLKDVRGIANPDRDQSAQLLDLERLPERVRHARRPV